MANVNVTSNAWTAISITSGTVQNISATADIELSAEQVNNSGVVLKPAEIYQWDNETIYARAVTEETGALRVVNFKKAAGGGGGYVLPVASASTLGGVKVGNNLSIDESGVLSATGGGGGYVLPTATASTLGGVIVGDNISVDANGEISTHAPYTLPAATNSTLGGVKVGANISVDGNGEISTHAPYSLPKADASTLGGVKVGSNISVDSDGVISTHAPYSLPTAAADTLGGVKIGSNITIDGNGAISAPAAYTLPTASNSTLGGIKIGQNLFIDANGVLSAATPSTDPVGRVVYDVILRTGYIKANGATVADASTAVPDLLQFVQNNPSLLAANQAAYEANVGLYLYDSGTDALTLPNYTGRVMQGGNSVEAKAAGLPNIKGTLRSISTSAIGGAFYSLGNLTNINPSSGDTSEIVALDASRSSSIYSDSVTTVQPPAITLIPQIKY